jgi:carboxymethylenebutenolidase
MSADLRNQCDWLAGAGYIAFGPNLMSWGRKRTCMRATIADLRARRGRAFDDIDAAREWLIAEEPGCNGRVGVIGYCMGGGFSLLLAPTGRYAVSSVNYGQVPDDTAEIMAGACPIVASYGARDRTMKGSAAKLEEGLRSAGVSCDVKEYPDAGHGFINRHDGAIGILLGVLGRLMGVGYEEASAADARGRIIAFFDAHLSE